MEEFYLKKITKEVFEKARNKSASHTNYALSKEVEATTTLSYRTVERAFDKYINGRGKGNKPIANTIEEFCRYLGYRNYAEYVENNKSQKSANHLPHNSKTDKNIIDDASETSKTIIIQKNWSYGSLLGIFAFTFVLILTIYFITENNVFENELIAKCMTWTGSEFEEIACGSGTYSNYGTAIEPYEKKRFENFRRVDVDITTQFFSEQNQKPLLWYYKNDQGEIEYYTSAGLHPVNGETLKAITEYIIEKYVPIHQNKPSSFVQD